jgi:thioredoxin-like negative regulator of GroEL
MGDAMHLELANDAEGSAQQAFGVRGIPHMVIIGRDGRILQVYSGYSESKLDEIVADINRALVPLP